MSSWPGTSLVVVVPNSVERKWGEDLWNVKYSQTFSLLTNFQLENEQLFRVDTTPFDSSLRCVKGDRA